MVEYDRNRNYRTIIQSDAGFYNYLSVIFVCALLVAKHNLSLAQYGNFGKYGTLNAHPAQTYSRANYERRRADELLMIVLSPLFPSCAVAAAGTAQILFGGRQTHLNTADLQATNNGGCLLKQHRILEAKYQSQFKRASKTALLENEEGAVPYHT